MESLRNGVRAVLVGCVVDLIAAQTHLLEVMPQHSCSPPRAERHCHVMRLRSHTPDYVVCLPSVFVAYSQQGFAMPSLASFTRSATSGNASSCRDKPAFLAEANVTPLEIPVGGGLAG